MDNQIITVGQEVNEDETKLMRNNKKGWSRFFVTVEPIKFCVGFTINFTSGVTIDMLQRNICHQNYNLSESQCLNNLPADIKSDVEGLTANMNMMNQVLLGFFPIILILFVGPWSDNNGRKPFTILPLLGFSVYYLTWAILAFYPGLPMIYLFIPSLLVGMTGGVIALYVCTWSYTTDNFEPDERPLRFSISISCAVIGGLIGNLLAGQVMHLCGKYGFQTIFFTSFVVSLFALVYTAFVLEETVVRMPGIPRTKLIDFENVKSTFMVLLIRPEKGILLSSLILVVLLCEIPLNAGDDGILYLIGKSQYAWDLNTYNLVAAISSIISAVSPVFLVWLLIDVLRMTNISVLVISLTLFVILEVTKALSVNQFMFWSSIIATKIGGVIGPAIDTELTLTVSENNIGKAFTMTSICDALTPLLSILMYTFVYKLFLPHHTLYVFFLSAILATIGLIASVGLFFKKTSDTYTRHVDVYD